MSSLPFSAHSALGKAYQSLNVFFPDEKKCVVQKVFGKRKRELPLDDLLYHIQKNEQIVTAYFIQEEHGEKLDPYNHVGTIGEKRGIYHRQKTTIETFLTETTKRLESDFYQLIEKNKPECLDKQGKVEPLLERIILSYTILKYDGGSLETKKMGWALEDFRRAARGSKKQEEKKQKRIRIQGKLDARILAAKKEYDCDSSSGEDDGMKEYKICQLEIKCIKARGRAERVGITLEKVEFVLEYCQRERESMVRVEQKGYPLVYVGEETAEEKEKPVVKIYDLPTGGMQETVKINEPGRESIDWLRYQIREVDEVPGAYAGTHSLLVGVMESTVMYVLRKAGRAPSPETKSERQYDKIIRGILRESYKGGYLKHLADLGLGDNRQIIERAIERNVVPNR
jgi:hypothetical protein